MVGLCNIVNGVLTGAAVSRGWEGAVSCRSISDHHLGMWWLGDMLMSKCPRLFLSTFKTHRSYIITYNNNIYIYNYIDTTLRLLLDAIGVNSIVGTHSLFWLCANWFNFLLSLLTHLSSLRKLLDIAHASRLLRAGLGDVQMGPYLHHIGCSTKMPFHLTITGHTWNIIPSSLINLHG
jgi:hypothetical protein